MAIYLDNEEIKKLFKKNVFPGKFIHAFDINGILAINNFIAGGFIFSRDVCLFDESLGPTHVSLLNMPIEDIQNGKFQGAGNPVMMIISHATNLENLPSSNYSNGEKWAIKRKSLEIEFEKQRRKIDSNLSSRVNCLFVTDDDEIGRLHLSNMFNGSYRTGSLHLVSVVISNYKSVTRADFRWVDQYFENPNPKFIENYWQGIAVDSQPHWEYLVEGKIHLYKKNEFEELQEIARKTLSPEQVNIFKVLGRL